MIRNLFFFVISIAAFSCQSEKKIASVSERWYDLLPPCPCRNPDLDSVNSNDGWARELRNSEMRGFTKLVMGKRDFTAFHPGATAGFRSYPYVKTVIGGKKRKSGQQCMYDEKGNLIKTGEAAGTPDKFCPAKGENRMGVLRVNLWRVIRHHFHDANPFKKEGWKKYHLFWPPNCGNNCN